HLLVVLPQERGAAEGRGQLARAVNHAAYDQGIAAVGCGDRIHSEHRHSQYAVFQRNVVDVDRAISVHCLSQAPQVGSQPLSMKLPYEYFRKTRLLLLLLRPWPYRGGIMDGEGCFVEVALELKPGRLNELLVLRIMGDLGQVSGNIGAPHPLQVHVKETIGAGQQTGGLGRGVLAKLDSQRDHRRDYHHGQKNWKGASYAHEERRFTGKTLRKRKQPDRKRIIASGKPTILQAQENTGCPVARGLPL